jgi:hypothetical protein
MQAIFPIPGCGRILKLVKHRGNLVAVIHGIFDVTFKRFQNTLRHHYKEQAVTAV